MKLLYISTCYIHILIYMLNEMQSTQVNCKAYIIFLIGKLFMKLSICENIADNLTLMITIQGFLSIITLAKCPWHSHQNYPFTGSL